MNSIPKYKSEKELTFLAQIISMGSIYFGYSMSVLSLASNTIFTVLEVDKNDIPYFNSILTASIPFGAMFGSVLTGKLLDLLSRKKSLILLDSLGIFAALLSQVNSIETLILSRLLTGIVTGFNSSLVPQYVSEISPQQLAGKLGFIFPVYCTGGIILGSFLGLFFNQYPTVEDQYWRFVFLFPGIFCIIRQYFMYKMFNHETPLYYALQNQQFQCDQLLQRYYKDEYVEEISKEIQLQVAKSKEESEFYIDMFKSRYRKRVLIGVSLQLFQQWSGINAVIMYSGQIFGESIKDFSYRNAISVLSNVVLLISCVASSFFVNKIGRKAIFIYGSALCACFLFTLSYLSANQIEGTEFLSVTFIFMYYLAFNFSLGPIVWIYNSEILPAKGISIATLANWYGGTVVTLVLPYFSVFWPLFLIFGIVCIGCVIFSMMCVKETLGKNKLQVIQMFEEDQTGNDNKVELRDINKNGINRALLE